MTVAQWSKEYQACVDCKASHRPHKAKGLCTRCYRIARKIEIISNWRLDKPETLIEFPFRHQQVSTRFFEKAKMALLREYTDRRSDIRHWASEPPQFIDGPTFEYLFNQICQHCGIQEKHPFFGYANIFDHTFNSKQKRELYSILIKILSDIPWHPNKNVLYAESSEP